MPPASNAIPACPAPGGDLPEGDGGAAGGAIRLGTGPGRGPGAMAGRRAGLGLSRRALGAAGAVGAAAPGERPGRGRWRWWSIAVLATTAAVVVDQARRGEEAARIRSRGHSRAERAAKAEAQENLTLAAPGGGRLLHQDQRERLVEAARCGRGPRPASAAQGVTGSRAGLLQSPRHPPLLGPVSALGTGGRIHASGPDQRRDRLEGSGPGGISSRLRRSGRDLAALHPDDAVRVASWP